MKIKVYWRAILSEETNLLCDPVTLTSMLCWLHWVIYAANFRYPDVNKRLEEIIMHQHMRINVHWRAILTEETNLLCNPVTLAGVHCCCWLQYWVSRRAVRRGRSY